MGLFQWLWPGRRPGSPRRSAGNRGLRPHRLQVEALEERATVSTIYGIQPGNVLIRFDSANPSQVTTIGTVSGIGANQTIRGIDFRPRTGQLFASAVTTGSANNSVIFTYTINPLNAQATFVGATAVAVDGADVPTGYDFNPTVDRIRYVNTNEENARLNPANGARADVPTNDDNLSEGDIIAEAYDRNFDRQTITTPTSNMAIPTTLYGIDRDTNNGRLVTQGGINGTPSPNAGAIMNVGALGFMLLDTEDGGFDIAAGPGVNGTLGRAFAALAENDADDNHNLYSINLSTGAATNLGQIGNGTEIFSIAVAPDSTLVFGSGPGARATVFKLDGDTNQVQLGVFPFGGFTGGVRVAAGDVSGDGVPDAIAAAGPGAPGGHIKVFDGNTFAEIRSFLAFPGFTGGTNVAAGDVNADGFDDIIVGAEANGHVKVFNGRDSSLLASFLAYPGFTGGVKVAAADFDLNGTAEIVTGAGAGGPGGHVKIFNGQTGQPFTPTPPAGVPTPTIPNSFLAYPGGFAGGISVAAGDVNRDGIPDVVVGAGAGAPGGHVKVFSGLVADPTAPIGSFLTTSRSIRAGANVALSDVNADGLFEVRVAPGAGTPGIVGTFNFLGQSLVDPFFSFGGYAGGTFIGGARAI